MRLEVFKQTDDQMRECVRLAQRVRELETQRLFDAGAARYGRQASFVAGTAAGSYRMSAASIRPAIASPTALPIN